MPEFELIERRNVKGLHMEESSPTKVKPVPDGYHTVTPWIIVKGAAKLLAFMEEAFGAKETEGTRFYNEDGTIGHVEVRIGDSFVMLYDASAMFQTTGEVSTM